MATNTKTLLTVKIDKALKKRAEETAASFGLPLGTMVNAMIRQTVEEGSLTLREPLVPSKRLKASMAAAEKEYASGKMRVFDSVEELIADLRS